MIDPKYIGLWRRNAVLNEEQYRSYLDIRADGTVIDHNITQTCIIYSDGSITKLPPDTFRVSQKNDEELKKLFQRFDYLEYTPSETSESIKPKLMTVKQLLEYYKNKPGW